VETATTTHRHLPEGTTMNIILQSHNIYIYLRSECKTSRLAQVCTLLSASSLVVYVLFDVNRQKHTHVSR